ncbi:STM4015 family protein [Phycisphaeraceae bacterium D3-23]
MILDNLKTFFGLPVSDFKPGDTLEQPGAAAVRVRLDWDDYDAKKSIADALQALFEQPGADQVSALVVGDWGGAGEGNGIEPVIEILVGAADKLPNLKALFLADMTSEECEVSWITQGDLSPLWSAYPALEELGVRGSQDLTLGRCDMPQLKKLVIETGGLPPEVVGEVAQANLPALEHLELWLGTPDYGGDTTVADLLPILNGGRFPNVRYLGLRNAELADEIAKVVGDSAITPQLELLDLSLGTLRDEGALALAASNNLGHLTKLDVHHHFMTDAGIEALRGLGVALDASDQQEPEKYRDETYYYVSVSE